MQMKRCYLNNAYHYCIKQSAIAFLEDMYEVSKAYQDAAHILFGKCFEAGWTGWEIVQ